MKMRIPCGCPIILEQDEAVSSSSTHCSICGAPVSSSTSPISQRSTYAINPRPVTHYQNQNLTSGMADDRQSMISTELLTEEVSPAETYIALSANIESEHEMDTEVDNQKPEADQEDSLPSPEEREEARRQSLSRQGFVLQEDAHGLRLSGVSSRPGGLSSQLSPYDVVRLAAELEGGIVPIEQRKRCPKCEAVVNPGDKRCQWCSETL